MAHRGLSVDDLAVGQAFPEDIGEFVVVAGRDGRAYSLLIVKEARGPVVADWHELDPEEMGTYGRAVSMARTILGTRES